MATSRPLLRRLLNTPDLAKAVPRLRPEVLHRVIQICGLVDSAEFVALATPAQLAHVLDVDLWHAPAPGADQAFDVDRFGVWLDVLMQAGGRVAAEKLIGLDIELVVAGFSRHAAVFDHAAVSSFTTLDGEHVARRASSDAPTAEIGGYVIAARRTSAWDTIVELLVFLHDERAEYFQRLMRGCVRLSNGAREADGFHSLLDEPEQDLFDLVCDRDTRQEQQGYVTPAEARAFIEASRRLQLDSDQPPRDPLARAYFRGFESTMPTRADAVEPAAGRLPEEPPDDVAAQAEPAAMAAIVEILRDAGVLTEGPRALLHAADREQSRLALIQDYVASHAASTEALAYLANAIAGGCSIQGRPFTPLEASDAAVAICNLGLENWPGQWQDCDLVSAFQVGFTVLHRDVSIYAAQRLSEAIAEIKCSDRDIQLRLYGLRHQLMRSVRDAAPWRARTALDVIVTLDAASWAALVGVIDECPVLHGAITAPRRRRRSIHPSDYRFISQNSDIDIVHQFMRSLRARLTR